MTSYIQFYYNRQQQATQLYLDEKKEFVSACNEYLTQYKAWHDLMQFYAAKDSVDTSYSNYDSATAKTAFYKWRNDIDAAYGKLYLLSDNEFGSKTLIMSSGLHRSLEAFATTDTLSVKERYVHAAELDLFFIEHWLNEAKRQIFQYNTGTRNQRSDEDYFQEIGEQIKNTVGSDTARVWHGDTTYLDGSEFNRAVFPEK